MYITSFAAPLAASLDYAEIIKTSGPIGLAVLALLISASIASWAIIVMKVIHLRRAHRETAAFIDLFWNAKSLQSVYDDSMDFPMSPVSQIFRAGYVELTKVRS